VKRVPVELPLADGTTEIVTAFITATPGLVVHEAVGQDASRHGLHWRITHQRSGLCVLAVSDPESAMRAAAMMAPLADWTVNGYELHAQLGVGSWEAFMELLGPIAAGAIQPHHRLRPSSEALAK
jgi:hypothetical protein